MSRGEKRWDCILSEIRKKKSTANLESEIILTYLYPRIDIHVSKTTNHLLKAPWCIHPKTGRVCVPIEVDEIDTFDPLDVPTLSGLVDSGISRTQPIYLTHS